jgi:hypothetical protein
LGSRPPDLSGGATGDEAAAGRASEIHFIDFERDFDGVGQPVVW